MPNPFVKAGPVNTSQSSVTDREAVQPVPEVYAGENLPYRGVMYHGVEPTTKPAPPDEYNTGAVIEYEEPSPEQEPVPVRVVNESARFQLVARANIQTITATNTPIEVAGRDQTRVSFKLVNTDDADSVYVGFGPNMSNWNGVFLLTAGKDVSLKTKEPVWVMGTIDTIITWIAEYEVPVDDD